MLQEINNFMNSLPAELKQAGLKPKEGLHVLLKIQEKEGTHFMDEQSVCRVCLTRKATEFDYPFLQHCATRHSAPKGCPSVAAHPLQAPLNPHFVQSIPQIDFILFPSILC